MSKKGGNKVNIHAVAQGDKIDNLKSLLDKNPDSINDIDQV